MAELAEDGAEVALRAPDLHGRVRRCSAIPGEGSPGPGNGRSVDAEGSTARIGDELRAALEDGPL